MSDETTPFDGGCACRHVRYRMRSTPLFVHCCHCRWCQRETGAAFALNAMIESERVELLEGEVAIIETNCVAGACVVAPVGDLAARAARDLLALVAVGRRI